MSCDFEILGHDFCQLAGFAAPEFARTREGRLAFTVRLHGVDITVVDAERCGDSRVVLVLAELGQPPQDDSGDGWAALLEANWTVMPAKGPVFSRNPHTGAALLQWRFVCEPLSPTEIYQRVLHIADVAVSWRHDGLSAIALMGALARVQEACLAPAADDAAAAGAARFADLHQRVCKAFAQALAQAAVDAAQASEPSLFRVRAAGVDTTFTHFPQLAPDRCIALVDFGTPASEAKGPVAQILLDANFTLISQPQGAFFSQEPSAGNLQLRYAVPLADADSASCLAPMVNLSPLVQQWKATVLSVQ
jgi:hypothetical protein